MSMILAKRTLVGSFLTAVSSFSTLALAQQQAGFTITPSIGYYNMDDDRDTKDDEAYSLGLGYQFDNPWAVEFVYLNADTRLSSSSTDVDVDQYRLDALYHLPSNYSLNLTPYLAAGIGEADFSEPSTNNTQLNAGGGVKYALNDSLSLRADFRLLNDVEDNHIDHITSVGLQMTFGRSPSKVTPEATPVAEAVSEPVKPFIEETTPEPETIIEYTVEPELIVEPEPIAEPAIEPDMVEPDMVESDMVESDMVESDMVESDMVESELAEETSPTEPTLKEPIFAEGEEPSLSEQAASIDAQSPVTLSIQFGNNKTTVEQVFYPEIEKLATYLDENPNSTVVIEGHTDNSGEASYNQTVSEKRAQAIADVLINIFQISDRRISVIGYGEDKPLFNNDTVQHRQANRRVTAIISSNEA